MKTPIHIDILYFYDIVKLYRKNTVHLIRGGGSGRGNRMVRGKCVITRTISI